MLRLLSFASIFVIFAAGIVERKGSLSKELKEISGWVFVDDTTLVAHNDSGNDPILYVLNLDGSIRNRCTISSVTNVDFEDITTDGKGNLYVGDIGNNNNTRKDLVVYKVKTKDVLKNESVTAKAIHFSYSDQNKFPPTAKNRYYDAEALAYYKDSLYIFTKCRNEPFDGKCMIYGLSTTPGTYKIKRKTYLKIGKKGLLRDAVTAADIYKDELHLLTYSKILIYTLGQDRKGTFKTQITISPLSQKESLAVRKNKKIYVTDERQKVIGGGTIFVITQKKAKKK